MENDDPVVSESESEEDDYVKLSEPSETAVNNKAGLLDKLGDISWPESAGWIHKLSVDIEQDHEVDVNDDLTRELAFYTQAHEGVKEAFIKLQSTEVDLPILRPPDYSAAMVKSETHMEEVKSSLLAEKREEEAEERRKVRNNEKVAKEVQKQKQKKDDVVESVKNLRKQSKQSDSAQGGGDDDDDDGDDGDPSLAIEDGKAFERSSEKRPGVAGRKGGEKKMKGRERKDSKYGFGGRKGMKKQNTAESMDDFRGYHKSNGKKQKGMK